jgi:dihydropyrimidinase
VDSLLITGGTVVTAEAEAKLDVFVSDGLVVEVAEQIGRQADRIIDASGRYVLPGGVDPHTHMEMPFGGTTTCDDFGSGTVAAAFGGTTTIVDFCIQEAGQPFDRALARWHEKIERCPPLIDVGFHLAITDLEGGGGVDALSRVPGQGVPSFKLFMAYKDTLMVDDRTLFETMRVAAETGALVMVHAENGDVIDVLIQEALAAGNTSPAWHAKTRPPITESEATNRAIQLAHLAGCRLYVVHVSCAAALAEVERARASGWDVRAETCTQYLFVDESALDAPGFEGAKFVFTPPPRTRDDQLSLWRALADGTLDAVSSDHCPFRLSDQKSIGRDDFSKIPNGAPTIEHRLHMLHHHGVGAGRITMPRLVDLFSTAPAKLFGLYPRKGTIAAGSDADMVIFDPNQPLTISAASHHSRVDYNVFEGMTVRGAPETVLRRGVPIVQAGAVVGVPRGEFVARRPGPVFESTTSRPLDAAGVTQPETGRTSSRTPARSHTATTPRG